MEQVTSAHVEGTWEDRNGVFRLGYWKGKREFLGCFQARLRCLTAALSTLVRNVDPSVLYSVLNQPLMCIKPTGTFKLQCTNALLQKMCKGTPVIIALTKPMHMSVLHPICLQSMMEWAYPSHEALQKCSQRELVFSKSSVSRIWALQHNRLYCEL